MNSVLADLLEKVREHYVSALSAAFAEFTSQHSPSVAELLLEPNGSTVPVPYRYIRIDMGTNGPSGPKLVDLNLDQHLAFDPWLCDVRGGLHMQIYPMVWNGIEFMCSKPPDSLEPLTGWVNRWLDTEDSFESNDGQFQGVIHSTTYPETTEHGWSFSVDFGSAPVSALDELLDILHRSGAIIRAIGSFQFLGIALEGNSPKASNE